MPKRSKEQWLQLLEQHAQSGLSANQFCKQNGVCAKSFSRRKKQLLSGVATKEASNPNAFVKAAHQPEDINIIPALVLQHGASQIILPPNIDSRWLASLLLALK